jgi:adenosine deaminase
LNNIIEYIRSAPKVELHLHIEGSFEPELVFKIAARNNMDVKIERGAPKNDDDKAAISKLRQKAEHIGAQIEQQDDGGITVIFQTPAQLGQAYDFDNLQEFLDIYYAGMNVLQTQEDFYDLTMAYLEKINTQNVRHTEIFFDPQGHTCRGVAFGDVVEGISRALDDAWERYDISSGLILSFLRHLSEEDALKTWDAAQPYLDKFIGVGLDSSELGHPPSKFKNVFALARAANLKLMAHAGEEGPADYIWDALDNLQIDRVDHGNRSLEDPALTQRLIDEQKVLTVCPLSNDRLQVVKDITDHPLQQMLDLGLYATVNSDDPAYFGGYMNENFEAVQSALNLTMDDIKTLTINAINGSFIDDSRKATLRQDVENHHQRFIETAPQAAKGMNP